MTIIFSTHSTYENKKRYFGAIGTERTEVRSINEPEITEKIKQKLLSYQCAEISETKCGCGAPIKHYVFDLNIDDFISFTKFMVETLMELLKTVKPTTNPHLN